MVSRKLGLHLIGDGFDPARLGKPRIVKLVDPSVEYKARVRAQVGPDCLIVIRFYEAEQPLDAPWVRAREWWERHSGQIAGMADPNVVFEGYNEIADTQAPSYAVFEKSRLELMHAAGLRSVVGNFSVGVPDLPVWTTYKLMLDEMRDTDVVGIHEYWPDPAGLADPYLCGHWRLVPELVGKRIVITECGRDRVLGRGQPGWKLTTNAETYIGELAQYGALMDAVLQEAVGGVVFQAGNTSDWAAFDVGGIWDRVVAQYAPGEEAPVTPRVGKPPFRLGPIFDRWAGYPITTRHGEVITVGTSTYAHVGTDFGCPEGTPLRAPFDAYVDVCGWGGPNGDRGWYIWLTDMEQLCGVLFCHMRESPKLEHGDEVKRGEVVGYSGNTGNSTGDHLHMRVASERDTADLPIVADYDPAGPDVLAEV